MFGAKLLAPVVHVYQEEGKQGLYIWPRVVCLFIHIQFLIIARTISGIGRQPVLLKLMESGRPEFYRWFSDWRSDSATALFGAVNKAAARQFQLRVQSVVKSKNSALEHRKYKMRRQSLRTLWRTMKSNVPGDDQTTDLAEAKLWHTLYEQMRRVSTSALLR